MKTVLLIEDNSDIRENTTELLELGGYKVISAANGQHGLELARTNLPDIILSDVMMPYLNGHELFDALKKDTTTRDIPFVFLTSSVERRDVQSAFDKGANGYIYKPFDQEDLFQTIERCLGSEK